MKILHHQTSIIPSGDNPVSKQGDTSGFAEILDTLPGSSAYEEIVQLEKQIERAGELTGRQLIQYQIKVSRFGLEVELTSKVAEGGLAALRRLQSNQ